MSDLKKKYNEVIKNLENNIDNAEDLEYAKKQVDALANAFLDEMESMEKATETKFKEIDRKQKDIEQKMSFMERTLNGIEKDIYDMDENYDLEITYEIKDSEENGDRAVVTAEIEVYDYSKIIEENLTYLENNYENYLDEDGDFDYISYNDYRLEQLSKVKDKVKYTITHDPITQSSKCNFNVESKDKCLDDFQDDLKGISWLLLLKHSAEKLFDKSLYEVSFCFNMKQFLVTINSELFQVDPLVFFLNGTAFVSYELIHFDSGIPLKSTEIQEMGEILKSYKRWRTTHIGSDSQ